MPTLSLELRPSRHPEVVLGPALLRGTKTAHVVFDERASRLYEIGAKEHFVLSRLDGDHTLSDIGDQYAAHFGRRLGTAEWTRVLTVLGSRNLLAGGPAPQSAAGPRPPAASPYPAWWRGDRPLRRLSALPERVYPLLRPCLSGYVRALSALVVLGMLAVLSARLPELAAEVRDTFSAPWLLLPVLALLCLATAVHELAHALVARHFGIRGARIGVRWTLFLIFPYCQADRVHVLPAWRQRASVAAAGPVSQWVFLLPFFALWLALPSGPVRSATGALLLANTVRALINCIPWPGTDGYHVLSHALNVSHLYEESVRYLRLLRQGRDARAGYPARARRIYPGYALTLIITSWALLGAVGWLIARIVG